MSPRTTKWLAIIYVSMVFAFALFILVSAPVVVGAVTTTIIGWNVPSAATFNNGIMGLMLPMAMMSFFGGIPIVLKRSGDFVVTMSLMGLLVGSLFGMLSLTASNATSIPFALPVMAGVFLVIWLWKGGS